MNEISLKDWPYGNEPGKVDYNFYNNIYDWVETTEKVFNQQLNCLPPAKFVNNCFMMGEPFSGDFFATFIEVDERFFCKLCSIKTFDRWAYREEIRHQIDPEYGQKCLNKALKTIERDKARNQD